MESNYEIHSKEGYVAVSINPKIYPIDVVMSAAYVFTNDYYVLVDGDPEEEIIVEIRPKKEQKLDDIPKNFNNELINYATYAIQSIKNQHLRQSILDRVLMTQSCYDESPQETSPKIDSEAKPWEDEDEPWFDDPEGIAVPWEEKYGDKDKE